METPTAQPEIPDRGPFNGKVSIIMPVLNGERYVVEALESIAAQTYKNYELVAVDDGSTDRTRELLHQYEERLPLRYVHHLVCQGIAKSVNDGIRHSSGQYITFLDHDDVWFPHLLATQVSYLESHPDVGMVHSDFQTIDPAGRILEESVAVCRQRTRPSGWVFRELFMDSFIAASSVLIRKECFDRLGGFNESLLWGDYHLWMRIAHSYKIDYVPEVLTKYRQHQTQSTRSQPRHTDKEPSAIRAIHMILAEFTEVRDQIGERQIRHRLASLHFGPAYYWLWAGQPGEARVHLWKALRLWPTNPDYYLAFALSLLPPAAARLVQRRWHRVRDLVAARHSASPRLDPGRPVT